MEKKLAIILCKDLILAKINISEHLAPANGKTLEEIERILTVIEMSLAWLKDYHSITDAELAFEN